MDLLQHTMTSENTWEPVSAYLLKTLWENPTSTTNPAFSKKLIFFLS